METCLKVLLFVGVVTAAPAPSSSPLPSHEAAVLAAVQIYNQEPGTTLAYRLLEAEPQPDWLVKDCSGFFSTEQDPPSIIIKCEEASE
nr:cathelicidin-2-like [Chelonoidis abingdonii]